MREPEEHPDDFPAAFEAAFARLEGRIGSACALPWSWPWRVAGAIRQGMAFAAQDPDAASLLTTDALGRGAYGMARYEHMADYLASMLVPGRDRASHRDLFPDVLERALVGGVLAIVSDRVDLGAEAELPALAPEAIEFVLTPYVGSQEARRISKR